MSEQPGELYSLLIPISGERLLVPRLCVAEVVGYTEPEGSTEDLPVWFLGNVSWNGRRLPVVSFEALLTGELPDARGRTRIVVFHSLSDGVKSGYFGVLTQGFPQLVRVNPDVLSPDPDNQWGEDSVALCRIRMINEYPLIPDLEQLEVKISQLAA